MQQTEGSFGGVGIVMGFPKDGTCQVMSVIEDTPSAQAGIQPKDEIIKIDGADVSNMHPDEMAAKVRGDEGTQVVLTVRRQGQEDFDVTLTRAIIPLTTAKGTIIDGTNIGYIRIASFSENTGKEFAKELAALNDSLSEEGLLVKKFQMLASQTQDTEISNKFMEISKRHQKHYNDLYSLLK